MTIARRLKQMVQADAHAVLDNIEEPEALIKQSIRDMQEALACKQHQIATLEQEQANLQTNLDDIEGSLRQSEQELDLCLAEDNEPLARHVIAKKLKDKHLAKLLEKKLDTLYDHIYTHKEEYQEMLAKLEDIERQAKVLLGQKQAPENLKPIQNIEVTEADIEVELLKQKRLQESQNQGKHLNEYGKGASA